jgi:hypothetical protein
VEKNAKEKEINYYGSFLKHYRVTNKEDLTFINSDANFPLLVYMKRDAYKGFKSRFVDAYDPSIKPGDRIVTFKYERDYEMNLRYEMKLVYAFHDVKVYEIKSKKVST